MSPVWEACLFSGSCICWHDWWDLLQSSKQPWVTSLPFPARVPAASCPRSVTASPSPHLVIKPRLYTVGVQVSICLHNYCQQLSINNCQGCFKAIWSSFSWHRDQVFLYLKLSLLTRVPHRWSQFFFLTCITHHSIIKQVTPLPLPCPPPAGIRD